jgi:hypothetical protein
VIGWEDILNEFLEGGLMRADVEALRWKIQLPMEARAVMDRDLRLVDDLGAAGATLVSMATAGAAVGRIADALGRENAIEAPAHWRWEAGVPTAGQIEDVVAAEDAETVERLTELRKTIPIATGALERLLSRIRAMESPGEGNEQADVGGGSMRLYPAGEDLKLDALAASRDVLEPDTLPGDAAPKESE